jgi:lantibiotic biosynthesis protein
MADPATRGRWRPILEGKLRDEALAAARGIAAALEQLPEMAPARAGMQLAEHALLNAYLGFGGLGDRHFELSTQLIERAIDAVAKTPMRPSLYGGFVGVAWVLDHLQNHELSEIEQDGSEDADPNEQVDTVLGEYLSVERWNDTFDLISGLVGLGVYLADRLPRPLAKEGLERAIAHLSKLATPMEPGITWWTPPEQLLPPARQEYPKGHANLGVAHGVPAAIALLAQACGRGVRTEDSSALLSRSLDWFRAQKSTDSQETYFGYTYAPGKEWRAARSAWCYGDPGISTALLCAARWTKDAKLEREAIEIGLRAAQRAPDRCGVVDAPLCHGAAGLGHLYNRMFQGSGDRRFLESALTWFERALEMKREGEGIGGFVTWRPAEGGWFADPSLLSGAAGVALALVAASTDVEPSWDRLLLASVPPVRS